MEVINTQHKHIKTWCPDADAKAMEQVYNLTKLPFLHSHVALMPDCHMGYGMPIGGVIAAKGAVIPNAVGVDIGCGMLAVRTSLKYMSPEGVKRLLGLIREGVPTGRHHNPDRCHMLDMPSPRNRAIIYDREYDSARKQMGTLGGGNHFIEIQMGSDGFIWFMIHSGSRNLGHKIATYYNKRAKEGIEAYHSSVPPHFDLAFFPYGSDGYAAYIDEMEIATEFAMSNRLAMAEVVKRSFALEPVQFEEPIHAVHNFARMEYHFGKNVVVHRKGATPAKKGELGIIPGSQGSSSFIVRGKGNPDSFESCSHGAGRPMGRRQAKETLDLEAEIKMLEDQDIIHSVRGRSSLDESTGAYKDIEEVMANQHDLVDIEVRLQPLGGIKG